MPHPNKRPSPSESSRVRHPSIRGIGIRYLLALTLPITGVVLVLYTVAQLFGFTLRDPRAVNAGRVPAIGSSTMPFQPPPSIPAVQNPKK